MHIVITTDIFGLTRHVTELAGRLESQKIVDPYQGGRQTFADEAEAYMYFTEHVGLDAYSGYVTDAISAISGDCLVVGFSVGAAAAWKTAGSYPGRNLRGVIGFYGSQIRHHIDLMPVCPITLVFPKTEEHFDVQALANRLDGKNGLECIRTEYLHGFMNPLSRNFDQTGYSKYLGWLAEWIKGFVS